MNDDSAVLLLCAGQEAGNVHEGNDRNVECIAETHEAGGFSGRVDVQYSGQVSGLVGHNADGCASHVGESYYDVAGVVLVDLEELSVVNDGSDDVIHVVRLIGAVGNDGVE